MHEKNLRRAMRNAGCAPACCVPVPEEMKREAEIRRAWDRPMPKRVQ